MEEGRGEEIGPYMFLSGFARCTSWLDGRLGRLDGCQEQKSWFNRIHIFLGSLVSLSFSLSNF